MQFWWYRAGTNIFISKHNKQLLSLVIRGQNSTSALYILIRPRLTLDQAGTALMFHSWLECSANGPVFIYQTHRERLVQHSSKPWKIKLLSRDFGLNSNNAMILNNNWMHFDTNGHLLVMGVCIGPIQYCSRLLLKVVEAQKCFTSHSGGLSSHQTRECQKCSFVFSCW